MKTYLAISFLVFGSFILVMSSNTIADDLTPLSEILKNEQLQAVQYWDDGYQMILCTVEEIQSDSGFSRVLRIYYNLEQGMLKQIEYETADAFLGFSIVNGDLLVTWVGGSAYHFQIYQAPHHQRISKIFDQGSHNQPELVDIDNDGTLEILLSEPTYLESESQLRYPSTTQIYKRVKNNYLFLEKRDWEDRLSK